MQKRKEKKTTENSPYKSLENGGSSSRSHPADMVAVEGTWLLEQNKGRQGCCAVFRVGNQQGEAITCCLKRKNTSFAGFSC